MKNIRKNFVLSKVFRWDKHVLQEKPEGCSWFVFFGFFQPCHKMVVDLRELPGVNLMTRSLFFSVTGKFFM